jgi:hypothetical protein
VTQGEIIVHEDLVRAIVNVHARDAVVPARQWTWVK